MRKRLLSAMLALLMMLPLCFGGGVTAAAAGSSSEETVVVKARVDGTVVRAVEVEGELYLFLPASADLTNLTLLFTRTAHSITHEEKVNVPSLIDMDANGRYSLKTTFQDGSFVEFFVMQGSGIPTLYLTSSDANEGRTWVDASKKNEAEGSMKLVATDGEAIYDGGLTQIKARGNSTFTYYPKKAYQIKLKDKSDLLGTGEKVKTWVLLANYGDATLMHDKLFKDLAADLGMPYTANCDWVNLYYDGEYRGVYLLSEKNSVGSTGIDITDMEEAYEEVNSDYGEDMVVAEGKNDYGQTYLYTENVTEVEDITGGWMIELNLNNVDEASGFYTEQGAGVNIKSPEWAGQEAVKYISEYYQAFEYAVYATDEEGNYTGYNAETQKSFDEYMDMLSLVQTFLLQEMALNPDGFKSSLYFYKDVDGIMYAGPIWDQDMTLGTGWTIYISPRVKDYHYLAEGLIQIPEFEEETVAYFYETFLPLVEEWLGEDGKIAEYQDLLADSAAMNYVLWPYVRVGNPTTENHLWAEGTDYDAVIADMADWVERRIQVLKDTFVQKEVEAVRFPDIVGHWAEEAINFVADKGIFSGTDKGFEPELAMTRAMLVTTLYRLEGSPAGYAHSFDDVAEGDWYNEAVAWGSQNGVVQGYGTGFHPMDTLTREQLAVMLYRYAKNNGMDVSTQGSLDGFSDGANVSAWAVEAMRWAVGSGLINGKSGGQLDPQGSATRAQVATIFERFMNLCD